MSSGSTEWGNPARRRRHRPWLATGWRAAVRLLGLSGLLLAGATLLFVLIAPMLLAGSLIARQLFTSAGRAVAYAAQPGGKGGVIVQSQPVGPHLAARLVLGGLVLLAGLAVTALLLPLLLQAIRGLAWLTRRVVADWSGVPAAGRELPPPGAYHAPAGYWRRLSWLLTDPATARDLRWTALSTCLGWIPTLLPAGLMAIGLIGFLAPVAGFAVPPPAFPGNSPPVLVIIGLAFIVTGLGSAPWLL